MLIAVITQKKLSLKFGKLEYRDVRPDIIAVLEDRAKSYRLSFK